jgi:hypothetical protein
VTANLHVDPELMAVYVSSNLLLSRNMHSPYFIRVVICLNPEAVEERVPDHFPTQDDLLQAVTNAVTVESRIHLFIISIVSDTFPIIVVGPVWHASIASEHGHARQPDSLDNGYFIGDV